MNDTTTEIAELVRNRLMALSGAERLEMGCRSFDAARAMMIASFPTGLSEREYKRLLFQRTYGEPPPESAFESNTTAVKA
jgi:hypothetical protein